MSTLLKAVVLAAAVAVASGDTAAQSPQPPQWQQVEHGAEADEPTDKVDVAVVDGYIYITVSSDTDVRVFTILGQLVTSRTVHPGTVRLKLSTRGIYILKAGALTRRINL